MSGIAELSDTRRAEIAVKAAQTLVQKNKAGPNPDRKSHCQAAVDVLSKGGSETAAFEAALVALKA